MFAVLWLQACFPRCDTVVLVDRIDVMAVPEELRGEDCETQCEAAEWPDGVEGIEEVRGCELVSEADEHVIWVTFMYVAQIYECKAM